MREPYRNPRALKLSEERVESAERWKQVPGRKVVRSSTSMCRRTVVAPALEPYGFDHQQPSVGRSAGFETVQLPGIFRFERLMTYVCGSLQAAKNFTRPTAITSQRPRLGRKTRPYISQGSSR